MTNYNTLMSVIFVAIYILSPIGGLMRLSTSYMTRMTIKCKGSTPSSVGNRNNNGTVKIWPVLASKRNPTTRIKRLTKFNSTYLSEMSFCRRHTML